MEKKSINRKLLLIPLLIPLLFNVFGVIVVQSETPAQQPRYGGTLVVGHLDSIVHLNGAISRVYQLRLVSGNIEGALVGVDQGYNFYPQLAQSWEISPDGKTYTFHLYKNITWHDDVPFTSADVKFTFEQVLVKYGPEQATHARYLQSIDTPDNYTVVMNLKLPFPNWLIYCGPMCAPMSTAKHLYENTDILTNPNNRAPIGVGPFKFAEWKTGQYVKLVANEKFFLGRPFLDAIIFQGITDATTRDMALEKGEIGFHPMYVPYTDVERLKQNPNIDVVFSPNIAVGSCAAVVFNLRLTKWQDIRVRQAIAMALNKTDILMKVLGGYGITSNGPILPVEAYEAWYNPALDTPLYEYNVTKANELLDQAGYPKDSDGIRSGLGRGLELKTKIATPQPAFGDYVAAELKDKLGLDIGVKLYDASSWADTVGVNWNFDIACDSISSGPTPDMMYNWFHTSQIKHLYISNYMGYQNSKVDELLDKASVEADVDKRYEYFKAAELILAIDIPVIWCISHSYIHAKLKEYQAMPERVFTKYPWPDGLNGGRSDWLDMVYWTKGTPAVEPNPQASTFELPIEYIGAIAAVAVVAVVAGVVLIRRRKRTK